MPDKNSVPTKIEVYIAENSWTYKEPEFIKIGYFPLDKPEWVGTWEREVKIVEINRQL